MSRIKYIGWALLIFINFLIGGQVYSQTVIVIDSPQVAGTTVLIPGYHFRKSGLHHFFWGKHYRDEWTTPVRVKNFYLDTAKGGLIPTQEGGSRQTRGLRMKTASGREYVLRSIDKDFGNGLGPDYKGTFIARIAKDQASIGHPYAAFTIRPMIGVTGIYHTNPQLVFVPKQERLGEYNEKFGDQLYLFEERPDENWEDAAHFGHSKNIVGTEKLLEKIYEDNDNRLDQQAYAKARLFDMFIGDWSRHADQWRWAEFENDNKTTFKPVPRDRDQAYTKFDGFFPWIATNLFGALFIEKFDERLNNTERFNEPARNIDMQLLNEVSLEEWTQAAKELQASLTDEVIDNAVRQMPAEVYAISGEEIARKLKSRRDGLQKYAKSYFEDLAGYVTIAGSQKREYFEIDRSQSNETTIRIYKINKEGEVKDKPYYSRTFKRKKTKEVRLYGLEGSDVFRIKGDPKQGVKLRIIDSYSTDSIYFRRSHYNEISRGSVVEFDTVHHKKFDFSLLPFLSPKPYQFFENEPLELFTRMGLKINFGFEYISHPWRKAEYENEHLINFQWGFQRKANNIAYIGRFRRGIGKWDFLVKGRYDIPAIENFYGVGNESPNQTKAPANFYSTTSRRLYAGVGVYRELNNIHQLQFVPFYQQVKVIREEGNFLSGYLIDETLYGTKRFAGISGGYRLYKANSTVFPTRGFFFTLNGGYVQNLRDKDRSFVKGVSTLGFYLPVSRCLTLAIRAGGATMSGEADYYHLNTLGGNENLRGYPRERFFGKHAFFNNNELRWATGTKNILFNGKIGLLAFYDQGRVWYPGENSSNWRSGYGGGIILVPFNKVALVGTYGISKETTQTLLRAEVFF